MGWGVKDWKEKRIFGLFNILNLGNITSFSTYIIEGKKFKRN